MANNTIAGFGECTLDTCGVQQSLFGYRPSLAASGVFIALFGISLVIHLAQGFRSRQWTFASLLAIGCAVEMIGYGGRIIMNSNPWSFSGFMLQISTQFVILSSTLRQANQWNAVCITIAPVFMTAAIYITLYKRSAFPNLWLQRELTKRLQHYSPGSLRISHSLSSCALLPGLHSLRHHILGSAGRRRCFVHTVWRSEWRQHLARRPLLSSRDTGDLHRSRCAVLLGLSPQERFNRKSSRQKVQDIRNLPWASHAFDPHPLCISDL